MNAHRLAHIAAAAALTALSLCAGAPAQQPYGAPYGSPIQHPYYCPPYAPYPPPGYAAPGDQPAPTPRAGQPAPPSTGQPDLTAPTADGAAAAEVASNLGSLSGATGTPTAPASPTPNAIGDFFGAPGDRVIIQQSGRFGSIPFFPAGGSLANFGESILSQPAAIIDTFNNTVTIPDAPVVFAVQGSASGFTSVNALGQAITRSQIGFLSETQLPANSVLQSVDRFDGQTGTFFLLNSGDAATQANLQVLAIQTEGEAGSIILLGGRATLNQEDGESDNASNVNGPILADFNNDGDTNDPGEFFTAGDLFYIQQFYLFTPQPIVIAVPNPGSGGTVGKVKLSDNNSARPQNRVFFDYQYFDSVPLLTSGVDVNRITPGLERTFNGPNGMLSSLEFRVPLALTLNSDIVADAPNDLDSAEIGNLSLAVKFLFYEGPSMQTAFGVAATVPTADDLTLSLDNGTSLIHIDNEAVHVIPYLAALFTPNNYLFGHAFAQLDYDVNGSPVTLNADGRGLRRTGRLTDQTIMFLDGSLGYWLYQNPNARISGVATMAEVHYSKTLETADTVSAGNLTVGDVNADLNLVNGTVGAHVRTGQTIITNGVSFPFNHSDAVFDWEYRLFVNRYF